MRIFVGLIQLSAIFVEEQRRFYSMATVSVHIEIACPVEQVFSFAGDYRNDVLWRRGVIGIECEPSGMLSAGTVTRERKLHLGNVETTVARVTEYEWGRRVAFEALDGPVPCCGCRTFEPTDSGTRLTYQVNIRPRGIYTLIGSVVKPIFARQLKRDLRYLKAILEQQGVEAAPPQFNRRRTGTE